LAGIRDGVGNLDSPFRPYDANFAERVVVFDVRGWELLADDGLWAVPKDSTRDFMLGRRPVLAGTLDARYPRLPVKVECPACRAAQDLDPSVLDVSLNEKKGYGRTRIV